MTWRGFLRDKMIFITTALLTAAMGGFVLYALNCPPFGVFLVTASYVMGSLAALIWEYMTKKEYYRRFSSLLEQLEKKHYISEVMEHPSFLDGQILEKVLKLAGKSMNDQIGVHTLSNREYREYVELWVHEINTPISGAKLICENKGYKDVKQELEKIGKYVEQALFYARSDSVEKDYIIRQIDLRELIGNLLKKNAEYLIAGKIKIQLAVAGTVYSDSKWLLFMLQQFLDNAVKYGAKTISFSFEQGELQIRDDGIGIPQKDLPRVWERGFTGENGRRIAKSTGMGLYLCKKLADKLGLELSINSPGGIKGFQTEISLGFPENPFVTFL